MRLRSLLQLGFAVLTAAAGALRGEVKLPPHFGSHMVLQRDMKVPIWGTAGPGEAVTVAFAGQTKAARAGADGRWRVELDPMSASAESRPLVVAGANRDRAVRCDDVLVGEVWLCSGQSNMDFTVAKTEKYYFAGVDNEAQEVAAANFPLIRAFTGEWLRRYEPQTDVPGAWRACTPETAREFSAIGYFFARDLQKEIGSPVGLIVETFGASTAQAWIRREAIAADPRLKPVLDEFDARVKAYSPPTEEELKPWREAVAKARAEGKRPPRAPRPDPVQDQHNPTVMFNGMIAPIVPCAIRGVLWYQGESITDPKELFPLWNETLITDWRKLWGRERTRAGVDPLPFYFVQLAALKANSNTPTVREQQTLALALPDTGMAVTIDIGDPDNVHPKNKQDVGARLARIALARTYGRPVEDSGPVYGSMQVAGGAVRLKFSHLGGGLVARGGGLKTFVVAGSDGKFAPAAAQIEGDTVVVSSPEVLAPVAVRYAWENYPEGCNLYNVAGLPAAPFRTDHP
jgi:sialate O-acetylesterase